MPDNPTAELAYDEWLIHAEYCPGPFFMGWHLYMTRVVDGVPSPSAGYTWLEMDWMQENAHKLAEWHGITGLPKPARYSQAFAEAFALARPQGLYVFTVRGYWHNHLRDWFVTPELVASETARTQCWRFARSAHWREHPMQACTPRGIFAICEQSRRRADAE